MHVVMICKGEYYNFMPAIARVLAREHSARISAMTFATPTAGLTQMKAFDHVYNLSAYLAKNVPRYNYGECMGFLEKFESSEDCANVNVMLYADRIIREYPFTDAIKILTGVYRFWEQLFADLRPDVVIGE